MTFAYADPVYLGCGKLYDKHHTESRIWDSIDAHEDLIDKLVQEYPDGWAMSCSSPSLRHLLPLCPAECRVMAWVKPFAIFKPNVGVAYAWEPIVVLGGRKRTRDQATVRDWFSHGITLKKGLTGAKPPAFIEWLLSVLNFQVGDKLDDLFPGTGIGDAVASAYLPDLFQRAREATR